MLEKLQEKLIYKIQIAASNEKKKIIKKKLLFLINIGISILILL